MSLLERITTFIVSQIICIPFFKLPFQDLKHPKRAYDMKDTVNLNIGIENETIGAWFVCPLASSVASNKSIDEQYVEEERREVIVGENETAILYLHGNAATRSQYHRRALYQMFQKMGHYVLAIDYRGYGDSSWISPSQTSMVHDAQTALEWLTQRSHPNANIFVWGHSLGTGVASKLCNVLSRDSAVSGYILEAPFNRMFDEVKSFKLSRILPFLGLDIERILQMADMKFDSTENLQNCRKNILILHAEDDSVIPFELAQKLYSDIKGSGVPATFVPFNKTERLGHDNIFKSKELESIVDNFFIDCTSEKKK